MKWLLGRLQNSKAPSKSDRERLISNSIFQATGLIVCLFGAGVFLSGDAAKTLKLTTLAPVSARKTPAQIDSIAHGISVKVLDRDFLGSGFIVKQSGNRYIVITNQHVLRAGEAPYKIETSDGIYQAKIVADVEIEDLQYDLAILEFEADAVYPTATIGNSFYLEVGEPVFAAGFPHGQLDTSEATSALLDQSKDDSVELALKQGRVVIILDRALEEGYQIGYTNDVRKGMSGGPLLNDRGEVVGVNGKHAYPLWESPEIYQDGSQPCPALQDLITRSSLAIPIEKSLESPQLKSLKLSESKVTRPSNLSSEDSQLISKMQLEAQQTISSCQNIEH